MIAISVLVLQTLTLPNRFGFITLFPDSKTLSHDESGLLIGYSSSKSILAGNLHFLNKSKFNNASAVLEVVGITELSDIGDKSGLGSETQRMNRDLTNDVTIEKDQEQDDLSQLGKENKDGGFSFEEVSDLDKNFFLEIDIVPENVSARETGKKFEQGATTMERETIKLPPKHPGSASSKNLMTTGNTTVKTLRCNMPPKTVMTISEMNRLLLRRRASALMRPQWLSARDKEILSARTQIENAPTTRNDGELYSPLFRNVSMFKRSYELMERMLKVYVYREGEKPIFHQPILKGLYASEGWFMKLMEGNKKFIVKDPRKAHLFYMPFSTRMLEHSLYVRNSHNRTNLAVYLRNYTHMISRKYSFWNRTSGADHFFVACHDWAPYETRHHMERCIKSMCNADVTQGFKIGKDVSFPETYVRSARNPLRDIGGEPASNRTILAFFAGSMHGYLRPILLSHWKNKDPDMKIFGRMPFGVASKMNYIHHMKTSKYCICAKGFEVNSPRVVEAIFYECIPVIISDNFVPPFYDVLNWDAFSVIVAEKDIPNLKVILQSIPDEKYISMQLAVKKLQQHFVWHSKPVKYDLFHMTLHSIWYSRVFMLKGR
ncbi:Xylogalacturonan beta-1,3-xylosyltransferase [Thalictrum thalictroides]|uniref:Xylogalacturonan beta-1,3-xylosyltransferase n=1 Tax=Thalictrum thalictroides TaxID=46969 RepID=A0A7J6X1E1_THATH|nr:Xylogalacturonan beta-1,3-xylosyltransferase [Thalictrum thalictroides]